MAKFKPIQYVGCYTLHLYCDRQCGSDDCGHSMFENKMAEFTGETFADCVRDSRKDGWRMYPQTRTAKCPECIAVEKQAKKVLGIK